MKIYKMNLQMFSDKDFFTSAFNEAYNITESEEAPLEDAGEVIEPSNGEVDDLPKEEDTEPYNPNDEELRRLYEERFGAIEEDEEETQEIDEKTQSALDLYKYLEENPHLVQAMRDVDVEGFKRLNNFVPDELTKKIKELEEYVEEDRYNKYIGGLKNKYSDFDEDKVLQQAEKHNVYDLELVYKAMKADSIKEPNMEEIRKQIKEEIMNELKQNSLETQSIVGGLSQKPIKQDETVKLSNREMSIARAWGMSANEYAKWR